MTVITNTGMFLVEFGFYNDIDSWVRFISVNIDEDTEMKSIADIHEYEITGFTPIQISKLARDFAYQFDRCSDVIFNGEYDFGRARTLAGRLAKVTEIEFDLFKAK